MKKKRKNLVVTFCLILTLILVLIGCTKNDHISTSDNGKSKDNKRIFVTSSSLYPMMLSFKNFKNNIVGTTPWVKSNSNFALINEIAPKSKNLNMSAIDKSYKVNIEEMKIINPDLALYYGNYQNDNLERVVPRVVNVDPGFKYKEDPIKEQEEWEKKISKTLGVPYRHVYKDEWKNTQDILNSKIHNKSNSKVRALFIWQDLKDIKVSGDHSYADTMMSMVGIENVAKGLKAKGDESRGITVTVEQIAKWNPDIIFLANGKTDDILGNSDKAKMWPKFINAIKEKRVYTTPIGTFNWGSVASDTPLLPLWMLHKIDNRLMSEAELKEETKKFYKNVYDFNLNTKWLNSIFAKR